MTEGVALAHDYATQRGGAERVALWFTAAFPGSPLYTTLYDPPATFPEFADVNLRHSALNRIGFLRHDHRLALPVLAAAVSAQKVSADILLASSSGWAHGYRGASRTIVYCHAPARWLYQRERYLGSHTEATPTVRDWAASKVLTLVSPGLRRWDRKAAGRADLYLANSTVTQRAIRLVYGIDAEVVPPPPSMLPQGPEQPVQGLEPGFLLCVARLMPYKNVDTVIKAALLAGRDLAVVGEGPDRARLAELAGDTGRVHLLGRVDDPELRWLYRNSSALVAASYEDYGLSPLEAGAFGRPSVVLRDGGYLDTVVDGVNGVFFDAPRPELVAEAIEAADQRSWDQEQIAEHIEQFAPERFIARLRGIVERQRESLADERGLVTKNP